LVKKNNNIEKISTFDFIVFKIFLKYKKN